MIEAIDFSSHRPALFVEDREAAISYRELHRRVENMREHLRGLPRPALAFQFVPTSVGGVIAYLACLAERVPLGLGEPSIVARARVITAYQPTILFLGASEPNPPAGYERISEPEDGVTLWRRAGHAPYVYIPHPSLALLLATSGSTGDAKFVRLSADNLHANAKSIAAYLALQPDEIAIQSLPIHYSYGLSIINSHFVAGAAVALTVHSFMRPEFWQVASGCGCTSFAGVPYMYETLHRLRRQPTAVPSVRTLTQAGGHLRPELVHYFHKAACAKDAKFFVMYGQTEATARIAYVPPDRLAEKPGSIGVAIPGGELRLESVDNDSSVQQLYYRGANVMLGYANGPADLARGDDQHGLLATGDLAERDADGFFRITGRLARFAKLFGKRINLGSVEVEVESTFATPAASVDGGDHLRIYVEGASATVIESIRAHLAELLAVPPVVLKVSTLHRLPLTSSGKKDYKGLA